MIVMVISINSIFIVRLSRKSYVWSSCRMQCVIWGSQSANHSNRVLSVVVWVAKKVLWTSRWKVGYSNLYLQLRCTSHSLNIEDMQHMDG